MESNLDSVMVAISDPMRRAILSQLALAPARISDVATPFSVTFTGVCKHIRVLERAGLIKRTRQGSEDTLQLQAEPLHDVARWIPIYERFWTARLDRLEEFFANQQEKPK